MLEVLANVSCGSGAGTIVIDEIVPNVVHTVVTLIKIGIPILLVIFGMLDLGKAVMAGKEDEMKKAQGTLIKRVVYAVLIFLVVFIVQLVMGVVTDAGAEEAEGLDWYDCVFGNAGVERN